MLNLVYKWVNFGSNFRKFWKNRVILLKIWPKIEQIGMCMGYLFLEKLVFVWAYFQIPGRHLYKKPNFEYPTRGKHRYLYQIPKDICLTDGNWQKWKRVFLTCPCHKICRDEAVGLKSCKYTWKITKFVKMRNLGQYRENLITS